MSSVDITDIQIEYEVIKMLSNYFSVGRRKIESNSRLVEDLYVDSMSVVEIVMALNEAFGIELDEVEVGRWKFVGDICWSVKLNINSRK